MFLDYDPGTGVLTLRFVDGVADCVRITWGAQQAEVLPLTCGVGGGAERDEIRFDINI